MSAIAQHAAMMAGGAPVGDKWYDALFLAGDTGMVFDFNDLSTLFQDTAHTIPVTTVGDPIQAIRCKRTGAYAVQAGGSMTLGYDATRSLYYGKVVTPTTGGTAQLLATGSVPSDLGGDSTRGATLIAAATFASSKGGVPALIGPASVGGGNAMAIGNLPDPGIKTEFLQFGAGFGVVSATVANGVLVLTGTKGVREVGSGLALLRIYSGAAANGSNWGAVANITTLNFNIGRIMNANDAIYSCVAVSRAITPTEVATAAAAALVGP